MWKKSILPGIEQNEILQTYRIMQVYRELTPLKKSDVFIIIDSFNNGFDYPIHNHPEFELNLVLGTSGTRIVGDSTEYYKDYDLVFLGPFLFHKWDIDKTKEQEFENSRVITIQFKIDLFNSQFFKKNQFVKIKNLLQASTRGIRFDGDTFEKASRMMIGLTEDNGFTNVIDFLQLLDLLANSKETNYLSSAGFSSSSIPYKGYRIQIAFNYILQNFNNKELKIKDVAGQLNMSISAFSHFFKKYSNTSFMQFLIDVRLGHTCKLLLDSDDSIKQICYSSGFNNVANFNRLFKKNRACTPFEFRRRPTKNDSFDWTAQITPGQFIPSGAQIGEGYEPTDYSTTRVVHY